jgi:hypothetical protein
MCLRHVQRIFLWLTLTALVLPAACDTGPTGPCFDPTDSGACTPHDSTHTANVRGLVATSVSGLYRVSK